MGSGEDVHLGARSSRNNPAWESTGTFRAPQPPSAEPARTIFPRLLKVDGRDLHVTDLDAVDGTPVYDMARTSNRWAPADLSRHRRGPPRCWSTTGPLPISAPRSQ
ncbi:hypothetical protein OHB36_28695 [Streptomyces sp. NBC_00320]|nr:hypothetical protein [Streptomyces sp. NBC_00320]